jgi:hypothetical protein
LQECFEKFDFLRREVYTEQMKKDTYTIGITGHRRLPPEVVPLLTSDVKAFYRERALLHGAENIAVLSSIAEGADTLCAKLALEAGLTLIVPLPMAADEYRKDFSEETAAEFDRLLSPANEVFVVKPEEGVPGNPGRGFYYRQAGMYVVKHCDILLAIWDGVERETEDGAGTWETVKAAKAVGIEIKIIRSA